MPYCPKCDMEFIEGILICSDCKGPLAESKEAAKQMEQKALAPSTQEIAGNSDNDSPDSRPGKVYIKKAEQYADLRSSFSAFLLVGGMLLLVAILSLSGTITLPFAASSKIIYEFAMIILSLGSFAVAFQSFQSACKIGSQVQEEELATTQLIEWFLTHHDAETIDCQLTMEGGFEDLTPEEQSLKRFELIQDIFLITHDISNQSYVDLLAEEVYDKLFD